MPIVDDSQRALTVSAVLRNLIQQPRANFLQHWNWKAALLSACVRGLLFFLTNLKAGLGEALGAFALEAAFYAAVAGFYGALIQSFRRAQPVWLATLTVMVLLPALNHTLEYLLHWSRGTQKLSASLAASVALSLVSALFNLFVMRRGALLVGAERESLSSDLRRLPLLVWEFLLVLPRALWRAGKV